MNISIIIPVYNVEKYILQCLISIYQDVINFEYEVIIIDDCSPDNSIDILNNFIKEKKITNIKIISHATNKGLAAARNTGIEHARFDYIWFIDSDDTIEFPRLDKIIRNFNDSDIILFGVNQTDEYLKFDKVYVEYEDKEIHNYNKAYSEGKVSQIDVIVWNKLIKTELFYFNLDLRFDERVLNEDELFSLLLCKYCTTVQFLNEKLYNYRIRANSITTSKINGKNFDSWEIIFKQAYDILKNYDKEHFISWFLEKVMIFLSKYEFTPSQLIKLKKITNNYFFLYPVIFWEAHWRFNELRSYFDNSVEVYKNDSRLKNPKVSVIIPTYKRPENLLFAINSVLEQTYKNIEIIVVNDTGKNHETQKRYDRVTTRFNGRVKFINLLYNTGGGNARNIGIGNSTGDYICFLDDDDIYLPDRIKNGVKILNQYNSDMIWGVYCGYYNNENGFENRQTVSGNLSYNILKQDYLNYALHTNTVLINKLFLEKHNIHFDNRLRRHQDLDLFLKLFCYGYVVGYENIDVELRHKNTDIQNWLNNENMHFNKRIYLRSQKRIIQKFGNDIQYDIYDSQWCDVLKYYIGENKIHRFEKFVKTTPNGEVEAHEIQFLYDIIEEKYDQLSRLNIVLSSKIELIYNSTSWRLTKPLRSLIRLSRGE